VKNVYTRCHENLTGGLVADMSWADGGIFSLCKEYRRSDLNIDIKITLVC
jgi:hypothetical protein